MINTAHLPLFQENPEESNNKEADLDPKIEKEEVNLTALLDNVFNIIAKIKINESR